MGASLSEVTAKATPRTKTVSIVLDGAAAYEIEELEGQLRRLRAGDDSLAEGGDEARRVAEQIEALQARAEASKTEFTFRSIAADEWANLFLRHGPNAKQRAQGFDHDPDGFQVAVVAACLVEPPGADVESVRKLRGVLRAGDWSLLFLTARALNEVPELSVPTSAAASATLRGSRPKPTTAAPEDSPGASSSDE